MTRYLYRQIRIEHQLYLIMKMFCVQNGRSLTEFYITALRWFIRETKDQKPNYKPTYRKGKLFTVRIDQILAGHVQRLANAANVSDACVIYTALANYIEIHLIKREPLHIL